MSASRGLQQLNKNPFEWHCCMCSTPGPPGCCKIGKILHGMACHIACHIKFHGVLIQSILSRGMKPFRQVREEMHPNTEHPAGTQPQINTLQEGLQHCAWLKAVCDLSPERHCFLPPLSMHVQQCSHWLALKEMRPSRSRSASSITARMSSSLTCSRGAIKPAHLGTARQGYIGCMLQWPEGVTLATICTHSGAAVESYCSQY